MKTPLSFVFGIVLIYTGLISLNACRPGKGDDQTIKLAELEESFKNPPAESGIRCWWWWLNSNVSKEAISRDLQAMHDKGYSGAMIFDAGTELGWGPDKPVPAGPVFGGVEWTELFLHALQEADRLNLEMGLSIQSGWNLGGPGVSLDDAAKKLCWSDTLVKGPKTIRIKMKVPDHNYNYYKDIALLAWPYKSDKGRKGIRNLNEKRASRELGGSAPDCRFLLEGYPSVEGEEDLRLEELQNISDKINENGWIEWDVPTGEWTLMRFGYTPTLVHVKTSSDLWKGRVIDYLSEQSFSNYWDDVVKPLLDTAKPFLGTVLKNLETDSWECGGMNWSPGFKQDFSDYMGYDPIPYLPVIAGKIVNNRKVSNAFLADFRKTIGECVSKNHYRVFAEKAAAYGLGIQPESSGPHAGPIDGIKNYSHSNITMSEFWIPCPHRPAPENRFFVKQAASAAHIYGKTLVGAESFTSLRKPHWSETLWKELKPAMDHEFCSGLNLIFVHTFTCSPKEMGVPGQEYFAGTHMNPQCTWWEYSDAFIEYMSRIQHLAQRGKFVADVLHYYGDHVPNIAALKESDPAGILPGYDYDVCNEDILLQTKVINGKIQVPGGILYELLSLPDHQTLSLAALEKIDDLLKHGAMVLGDKPLNFVSLAGGAEAKEKFKQVSDRLWGESPDKTGNRKIGKGHLFWGITGREVLDLLDISPDFMLCEQNSDENFDYIHYRLGGEDVYFVSNQSDKVRKNDFEFRAVGREVEIWDPITGLLKKNQTQASLENKTRISLEFSPYESYFVVFRNRKNNMKSSEVKSKIQQTSVDPISGPWKLTFNSTADRTETLITEELFDWSESENQDIKYYSGEAIYHSSFSIPDDYLENHCYLILNKLGAPGIATVKCNGKEVGQVWTPPFKLDIGKYIQKGVNTLEIGVVNNWLNRLIGERDEKFPVPVTSTNIKIKEDWKLQKSGLLGPVQLVY